MADMNIEEELFPLEGTSPIEQEAPAEGETPSAPESPSENNAPQEPETPSEGESPAEGETPAGETMQDILDDLRESLSVKDTDVNSLTESVRSLVNAMSIEAYSAEADIPFPGWESWEYPVRIEGQVYPYGAGYWMPLKETFGEPAAFASRYRNIVKLCGNGGSLKDFRIEYIYEDAGSDERLVYDYEAQTEAPAYDIPFEGYEDWSYPVGMQYKCYPYGAGYWMTTTEVFSTPQEFAERYTQNVTLCGDGGTLKDFIVEYIWEDYGGSDQYVVYDYQANAPEPEEPPIETADPELIEILQSMDARLETIGNTLDGIDSLSANTLSYYEDTLLLYKEQNELLTHTLALNMAILFVLVVAFGHKVAHALWQRMRVG